VGRRRTEGDKGLDHTVDILLGTPLMLAPHRLWIAHTAKDLGGAPQAGNQINMILPMQV
jgi:hypothetical protein